MAQPGSDQIEYGQLMHRAMRGLIKTVLGDVGQNGLPGEHHFFITFDVNAQGVQIAPWLRERYPDEMTIVIQHWFDGLEVDDAGFDITLNFGDQPEALRVPFDAIVTFVDPSVEFGLRFEARTDEAESAHSGTGMEDAEVDTLPIADSPEPEEAPSEPAKDSDADVVSLDSFRKGS
ncbi:MAG: ClpXP protease specificity-enhancing factor SspB [Pseudomonadota bacterium]